MFCLQKNGGGGRGLGEEAVEGGGGKEASVCLVKDRFFGLFVFES